MRLAIQQESIPVDPTPFDILHIVMDNKNINSRHQLEIANIREQIRLHDADFH